MNIFAGVILQSMVGNPIRRWTSLSAPLKTSILLDKGNGTPTFGRPTTATFTDFEGVVRTAKVGEARFAGMRRVENLYANSSTLSTQGNTVVAGVYLVQFRGTGSVTLSGAGTGTINGTGANNLVWSLVTTTAGTLTSTVSGSVTSAQLENVTGQSTQTPGEYLATGTGGWLATELTTNGDFSNGLTGWSVTNGTPSVTAGVARVTSTATAQNMRLYGTAGFATVVGKQYLVTGQVVNMSAGLAPLFSVGTGPGTNTVASSASTSVPASLSFIFTATATTTYVWCGVSADTGAYFECDNISVRECLWYGAGVDGVRYFDKTLAGTPVADTLAAPVGYFTEGARTNLESYSQDYTNAAYTKANVSVSSPGTILAPDGTLTAQKVVESATSSLHYTYHSSMAIVSGSVYTYSIYLKAAERRYVTIQGDTSNGYLGGTALTFDLQTGAALTSAAGVTALPSVNAGNGWWRISVVATATGTTALPGFGVKSVSTGTGFENYVGDGTSGVYAWGSQLELGSTASSYIPTTSAAVTRTADSLSYPTAGNFSDVAGTALASFWSAGTPVNSRIVGDGTVSAGPAPLQWVAGNAASVYDGTNAPQTVNTMPWPGNRAKAASGWSAAGMVICANGGADAVSSYDGAFALNSIGIGTGGNNPWYGVITDVRIFNQLLPYSYRRALTQ